VEEVRALKYRVVLDSEAIADLRTIRVYDRRAILDAIETILSTTPVQVSRSRIKRLRGIDWPEYRLRVGEFRIFYDVTADEVNVMRVLCKKMVEQYLKETGHAPEND
jgi:mRNA-degrading endonuclease RelE of RelBE toxin-antitoxin system